MAIFNLLQLIGGIILAIGYVPQIAKTLRTKSVEDFNINMYRMLTLGIGLMEIYAIALLVNTGAGIAFLITNTISLSLVSTMMILTTIYRKK